MSFNPDPIKQAQEIIFSRKNSKSNQSGLTLGLPEKWDPGY